MVNVFYLDTSALIKYYVAETGSEWITHLFAPAPMLFTSRLTAIEATCALARRRREGTVQPVEHAQLLLALDYDLAHRYRQLDITSSTMDTARRLANQHPLRAYDAVHLAAAWLLNQESTRLGHSPLTFVCADARLLTIAQTEGLWTDDPTDHP